MSNNCILLFLHYFGLNCKLDYEENDIKADEERALGAGDIGALIEKNVEKQKGGKEKGCGYPKG